MAFTVARTIGVPNWDDVIRTKAKAFWAERRITFTEESAHVLAGRRGSLAFNLISFDPTRLMATLTITSLEPSKIDCVLTVNTFGQAMTDWNKACLNLEMATFESYLVDNDRKEELWARFLKRLNIANVKWALTFGILGSRMSSREKSEFKV